MKTLLSRAGLGLFYLAFVLLSGEFLIRVISAVKPIYSVEMVKYATTLQTRSTDPNISHVHRPNSRAKLMGVEIELNSLGHRSKELARPKPSNEKRIFVLGSSITLGWGVAPGEVFTAAAESMLNRDPEGGEVEYLVVNAGIANYNTFHEVELFKKQAEQVEPDMVVVNYFINDAEIIPFRANNPVLRHSLFLAFLYQQWASLQTGIQGKSLAEYYRELHRDGQPGWEQSKRSMRELKALCDSRDIPLMVMLTPNTTNLTKDESYPPLYEQIGAAFQKMRIDTINTYPLFHLKFGEDPRQVWVAPGDPHPNSKGHRIMADELYRYIRAHPL